MADIFASTIATIQARWWVCLSAARFRTVCSRLRMSGGSWVSWSRFLLPMITLTHAGTFGHIYRMGVELSPTTAPYHMSDSTISWLHCVDLRYMKSSMVFRLPFVEWVLFPTRSRWLRSPSILVQWVTLTQSSSRLSRGNVAWTGSLHNACARISCITAKVAPILRKKNTIYCSRHSK